MVTVKSKTIKTAKFEHEIIKVIKEVKDMQRLDRNVILDLLRALHNNCLEYVSENQNEDFYLPF